MKHCISIPSFGCLAAFGLLWAASVEAAPIYTTGLSYDMSLGSTWVGGIVPGVNDVATFSHSGTYTSSSPLSFGGMNFNISGVEINPAVGGPTYTINLGNDGITGFYVPNRFGPNVTYQVGSNDQIWSVGIDNFQSKVVGNSTIALNASYGFRGNNSTFAGIWNLAAGSTLRTSSTNDIGAASARLNMGNGAILRMHGPQSQSAGITLLGASATFRISPGLTANLNGAVSGGSLAAQSTLTVLPDSGTAQTLTLNGSLAGHVGPVVVERSNTSAGFTVNLGATSSLSCVIGANGIVDGVDTTSQALIRAGSGAGSTTVNLNCPLNLDLTGAAVLHGNFWRLVDTGGLVMTYGSTFSIPTFAETAPNSGIWTRSDEDKTWTFTEASGLLSLSITPPTPVTDITTTGASLDLSQGVAWDGGVVPQNSWQSIYTPVLDVPGTFVAPAGSVFTWQGLRVGGASAFAGTLELNPASGGNAYTIKLGANGISGTRGIDRLGSNLTLDVGTADQIWSVALPNVQAQIRGTATVTSNGSATPMWLRTANPNFTGTWRMDGGQIHPDTSACLGAAGVRVQLLNGGILRFGNSIYDRASIELQGPARIRTSGNISNNGAVSTFSPGSSQNSGRISGSGNLTLDSVAAYGAITLNGDLSYSGSTTITAPSVGLFVTLGSSSRRVIGVRENGVCDQITGESATRSHLRLDGALAFDLSAARVGSGNTWTVLNRSSLNVTYGPGFSVEGFTLNSGLWKLVNGRAVWTFDPATGGLSFALAAGNRFVDPANGSDTNVGTEASPFKTLARADQAAQPGDVVLLRGGIYRETFAPTKSGQPGNPITYAAYPNEEVVFTAYAPVTGWVAEGNGIYRAPVATAAAAHVLINGESGIEARYPNHNSWEVLQSPRAHVDADGSSGAFPGKKDQVTDNNLPANLPSDWLDGAKMRYKDWYRAWSRGTRDVSSFNPATKTITVRTPFDYDVRYLWGTEDFPYELYGSKGLIDADNEWAYVAATQTLYFKTPGGVDPAGLLIESKSSANGLNLSGRSHLRIENITVLGGRILTNSTTTNCVINNIRFRYATDKNEINGTDIEISDSRIVESLSGTISLYGARNRLVNNEIREIGGSGTFMAMGGMNHLVAHNSFSRSTGAILQLSPTWKCQIRHNIFKDGTLRVKDMGSIYTVYNGGMTEIDHNHFYGDYRELPHTYGVYLDGGASHYSIHHNVSFRDALGPPKLGILYFNNTIYRWINFDNEIPEQRYSDGVDPLSDAAGRLHLNGLYAYKHAPVIGQPSGYYLDEVAANPGAIFNDTSGRPLDTLEDPSTYDFTIKPGSAAVDAGYHIEGVTDGFSGTAPDLGAYEAGQAPWKAGADFVNKPTASYDYPADGIVSRFCNLLKNGSLADPAFTGIQPWQAELGSAAVQSEAWNWPPADLTYLPEKSLKVASGAARFAQQVISVPGGRTYTFSVMVRPTAAGQTFEAGVRLPDATVVSTVGANFPVGSKTWSRLFVTLSLPPGTHAVTAYFGKTSSDTSTAYFDEAQLYENFTAVNLPPAFPRAVRYQPTVDTSVSIRFPEDKSKSTVMDLYGSGANQSTPYFKYDLAAIAGRSIQSAQLFLYGSAAVRYWTIALSEVTTDWAVDGPTPITWSNQPAVGPEIRRFQFHGGGLVNATLDITEHVQTRLQNANGLVNLTLKDCDNSEDLCRFVSSDFITSTPPYRTEAPLLAITFALPPAPANLSATTNATSIALAWTGSPDALSYEIRRWSASEGEFSLLGTSSTPGFVDTSVQEGTTYTYTITGLNETGAGVASNPLAVRTRDVTPPVITVPSDLTFEAVGSAGVAVNFATSALDNINGAIPTTATPASGSIFPIGTNTVTVSATDAAGNTASETFTVTVRDTTAPMITVPSNLIVEATGPSGRSVTFATSATDSVDGVLVTSVSPASGSAFPIGITTVTVSGADAAGNAASETFTVTVRDTTAPTITTPSGIVAEATGPSGAVVTFTASATDTVSGALAVTANPASGTSFPVGSNTVTVSASDAAGNIANKTFVVTVRDTVAPVITALPNMKVTATGPGGSVVTFNPTATDTVGGTLVTTSTPASGSLFAVGSTPVTVSATDAAGNTVSQIFTITVENTSPPVTGANLTLHLDASKQASFVMDADQHLSRWNDASGGTNYVTQAAIPNQPTVFVDTTLERNVVDFGNYVAGSTGQWLQFKNSGGSNLNISTIRSVFVVMKGGNFLLGDDNNYHFHRGSPQESGTAPLWHSVTSSTNIKNGQTYLNGGATSINGVTTAMPAGYWLASVVTTGNVEASRLANDRDLRTGGQQLAEVLIYDRALTESERKATEAYLMMKWFGLDVAPPVITVPADITLEATDSSGAVATFSTSALDSVSGACPTIVSPASGSTLPLGTNIVTVGATDAAGNAASKTFTVTVRDTTAPVVTAPNNMLVEATGPGGAVVIFTASATDTVSGVIATTASSFSGTTFPIGPNMITVSATDASGNTATGTFTITVRDTTPPVITVPSNITMVATSVSGRVVTFTTTASDTVNGTVPAIANPASGANFPVGTTVVTVTASDAAGNPASRTFTITVTEANYAPVIVAIGNKTVIQGETLTFTASATDANTPAQLLTFSLEPGAPSGATINPTTGVFSWAPSDAQGAGSYPITLRVTDNGSPAQSATQLVTVTVTHGVPSPWASQDIGAIGLAGSAAYVNGSYNVTGSGADIWATADEFRYVSQTATGDCEFIARVTSVQNTDAWSKAGVMIRETMMNNSAYASIFVTPGNGITFQRRTTSGSNSSSTKKAGITAPCWVKIARVGSVFSAYYSANGTAWTQLGTGQSIAMTTNVTLGMAVTSHRDGLPCAATFSNVSPTP